MSFVTTQPEMLAKAGVVSQAAAVTQAAGSSQASLSRLITTLLQSLASPSSSTSSGSGLSVKYGGL